jgi:hypothetical protein
LLFESKYDVWRAAVIMRPVWYCKHHASVFILSMLLVTQAEIR